MRFCLSFQYNFSFNWRLNFKSNHFDELY